MNTYNIVTQSKERTVVAEYTLIKAKRIWSGNLLRS